ncbi:conserved hypothetical protein [delta proteobacterium NaphS2]|nr:conserved hypothetical protein [delta proteobacterium NaphS2]
MEITKRFVFKEKNSWAGPLFGPMTVMSLLGSFFIGWWLLAFTAVGALGLWKFADWDSEKTLESIRKENIDDAQLPGYEILLKGFGVSEVVFIDRDKNLIIRQMIEDFRNKHWIIEAKCHVSNIIGLKIRTKPDELATHSGPGKFTIAGTLMYGVTGLIVGSIIDSLKGPKRVDFELDIDFEFDNGESLTFKAFRSAFGVTDDNRNEFETYIEKKVMPKMQKALTTLAETFPDIDKD